MTGSCVFHCIVALGTSSQAHQCSHVSAEPKSNISLRCMHGSALPHSPRLCQLARALCLIVRLTFVHVSICSGKALQSWLQMFKRQVRTQIGQVVLCSMQLTTGEWATDFILHCLMRPNSGIVSSLITRVTQIVDLSPVRSSLCLALTRCLRWRCFAKPGTCQPSDGTLLP